MYALRQEGLNERNDTMSQEEKATVTETAEEQAEKEQTAEKKTKKTEKKKSAEVEKLKAELDTTKDMLLRTAAEYDNFKRRTEKEKTDLAEFVKANTVKQLLPVADNIQRAASSDNQSPDYIKGLEMIIKQLSDSLDKIGLKEIDAEGKPFDPNEHEAVMHIEDENYGENTVIEVLQTGYKLGNTVIRPAMVKVAN